MAEVERFVHDSAMTITLVPCLWARPCFVSCKIFFNHSVGQQFKVLKPSVAEKKSAMVKPS